MLRYVDAVARAGSIRAAAEKLNIVSSALTRRILDLEQELGTPLFERNARGVKLTAAGEAYLRFARNALSEHGAALSQIEDLKGLRRGNIQLSSISSIAAVELPALIAEFQRLYPRVTFEVSIMGSGDVVHTVVDEEADCGIAFNPPSNSAFRVIARAKQQLCAVVHRDHPISSRDTIRLADCSSYPVALGDATWGGRQMLEEYLVSSYVKLNAVLQTNSNEILSGFVRKNNGIYFQIRFPGASRQFAPELIAVPLTEFQTSSKWMALGVRNGRALPVIVSAFCEFLRNRLFLPVSEET